MYSKKQVRPAIEVESPKRVGPDSYRERVAGLATDSAMARLAPGRQKKYRFKNKEQRSRKLSGLIFEGQITSLIGVR